MEGTEGSLRRTSQRKSREMIREIVFKKPLHWSQVPSLDERVRLPRVVCSTGHHNHLGVEYPHIDIHRHQRAAQLIREANERFLREFTDKLDEVLMADGPEDEIPLQVERLGAKASLSGRGFREITDMLADQAPPLKQRWLRPGGRTGPLHVNKTSNLKRHQIYKAHEMSATMICHREVFDRLQEQGLTDLAAYPLIEKGSASDWLEVAPETHLEAESAGLTSSVCAECGQEIFSGFVTRDALERLATPDLFRVAGLPTLYCTSRFIEIYKGLPITGLQFERPPSEAELLTRVPPEPPSPRTPS